MPPLQETKPEITRTATRKNIKIMSGNLTKPSQRINLKISPNMIGKLRNIRDTTIIGKIKNQ